MKPLWLERLLPRAAQPVTLAALLPVLIFSAVYAASCLALEWMHIVLFARPAAFALAVLFFWFWWVHHNGRHGLGRGRARVALVSRLLLAATFVTLLAEPRAVRTSDVLSVVYALDVSDSIGDATAEDALAFVARTVQEKPDRDQAGLVVFGANAAVELPPRETFPFEVINARVGRDGTSLQRGLSLAAAMIPDEHAGRIVLISDGAETAGSAVGLVDEMRARQIPVDVLPVNYEYTDEVWLEKLELPSVVTLGETYEASIVLASLRAGSGKLILRENDEVVHEQDVEFGAGKSRFTLPLYLRQAGYYEYVARIEPEAGRDGWRNNNVAMNQLYLRGEGKVLLVTDPMGDGRDWRDFANAMGEVGLTTETRDAFAMPRNALSLMPYDTIVFANVPADAFDAGQINAVHDAVYGQGVGFLMLGGKNSFGAGGYNRSQIEQLLPVSMDVKKKKVLPKGALAIILHTCEFAQGNTWGKRIAKEAIRVLGAQDEVGVLVYSWGQKQGDQWLFPLTPAGEYERLVPLINNAQIGDMPSFSGTMKMGLEGLRASDAATKHMIIISDGDPSPPPPKMVNDFVAAGISVSTVAINPHGGQEVAIMRSIAGQTGGRYYFPQDPQLLPSIFIKEAKTLKRSMIQNTTFVPVQEFPSPIMKGIDAIPPLHGFVITVAKPRARTVLVREGEGEKDPVLATWRYGLATTGAFTSDLAPNWGRDWVNWNRYRPYVKQLMTAVARVQAQTFVRMSTYADGTRGFVTVEDHHPEAGFLDVVAQVRGPGRIDRKVALKQVAPRMYQGEFPLEGIGRYQVVAAASGAERSEQAIDGFTVPYSPEYLRFRSNPVLLRQLAERTGGRLFDGQETGATLFGEGRQPRRSSVPIFDWFLWALACLLPLDVAVRRIQIDLASIRALFARKRSTASTQTMGALLKRKQSLEESRQQHEPLPAERTVRPAGRAASGSRPPRPERDAAPAPEAETEAPPTTTTGRLLARKKKWNQDESE